MEPEALPGGEIAALGAEVVAPGAEDVPGADEAGSADLGALVDDTQELSPEGESIEDAENAEQNGGVDAAATEAGEVDEAEGIDETNDDESPKPSPLGKVDQPEAGTDEVGENEVDAEINKGDNEATSSVTADAATASPQGEAIGDEPAEQDGGVDAAATEDGVPSDDAVDTNDTTNETDPTDETIDDTIDETTPADETIVSFPPSPNPRRFRA